MSGNDWFRNTNIYEVNLRQYSQEGTFIAFGRHLARLKDMGIETLWFMPLTPISIKHRKGNLGSYYACADYKSVNKEFGSLQDFRELVIQAHDMGFKVILDWVANHTGWDHTWTIEHPDWYKKDNHTGDFKSAAGMDDIIELDFSNASMRLAMIECMEFWIRETDIDGFRCDLAFWVPLDFWHQAKSLLEKTKKLFWLAESDPLMHPEYATVFQAAYTWSFMVAAQDVYVQKKSLFDLEHVLNRYNWSPGLKTWFTTNHDENSWNGTEFEKYGELAEALAVLSMLWPGLPLIYSGQEMPNKKRLAFFEKDTIAWNENFEKHAFYKTLLELRKNHPALDPEIPVIKVPVNDFGQVGAFARRNGNHMVLFMINFSAQDRTITFEADLGQNQFIEIFSGRELPNNEKTIHIPAWKALIFKTIE